jgi:Undecaprenyl-phosphate glucose phosphotransferase
MSSINYTLVSRSGLNKPRESWKTLAIEGLSAAILLGDVAAILIVAVVTGVAYHEVAYRHAGDVPSFLSIGAITATMLILSSVFRGEYRTSNFAEFRPHLSRTTHLWNVIFVALLAIGFLAKVTVTFSRGWMILFYATGLVVLIATRFLAVQAIVAASRAGLLSSKRVFLVGTGPEVERFVRQGARWPKLMHIVGCRFLTPVAEETPADARKTLLEEDLAEAKRGIRYLEPDAIVILAPWSDTDLVAECVETMQQLPGEIHLGPQPVFDNFNNIQLARFGASWGLQLTRQPLSPLEVLTKRAFDLVVSGVALALLTPLFLMIAILIKLDSSGPVFFLQQRYGFNQRPFRIIKFRTMRTLDDGAAVRQATRDDQRVTRFGRWLRRTNLDELPQLFNVIAGDMSLIGPRPHALSHNHEYEQKISLYARRHNVKPGITGWAQIHGLRGETDTADKMQKRVEHDLYYIDNWSFVLDLVILVRTILSRSAYRNAY